jgi:acetyl esterase/lipase
MHRRWFACLAAAFAVTASPATAQQAGALVEAEPVRETPPGMQAWRIEYWTTRGDGARQRVTGMVVAPREAIPREPRRVIAWAHGTSGVVERCALSTSPLFFTATPALAEMIRQGYVVVAPDYPGLGSRMPHPYLVGGDTARSVLDAVRAARAIPGAAAGTRFAAWGESQGGHAALWTASQARQYAPELQLVGTAAAAPPTALADNFRLGSDPNIRAMLTAFATYSWSKRFGAPLSTLAKRNVRGVITRLAQNNCIELGKTPRIGTILGIAIVRSAFEGKDLATISPWDAIIRDNSVDPLTVPGPVLIAQSAEDPVVAPAVTHSFARALCRMRAPLRWIPLPGGSHATTALDSAAPTLDWVGARFAGEAPPNDCAALLNP